MGKENNIDVEETSVKEETKQEETSKNPAPKKKKTKIILIILAIVLIIAGLLVSGYGVYQKFFAKDAKEDLTEVVMEPPLDVEYVEMENTSLKLLNCVNERTKEEPTLSPVKVGDTIKCKVHITAPIGFKISELFYTLMGEDGLELTLPEIKNKKYENYVDKDSKNKMIFKNPTNEFENEFEYQFKVVKDKNLNILLSNIVFKTTNGKYYTYEDETVVLLTTSNEYHVYMTDYGDYRVYNTKEDRNNEEYISTYTCETDKCEYKYIIGKYVQFEDNGIKAFNLETKEVKNIEDFDDYETVQIVADSLLRGVIYQDDGTYNYYSFEANKIVYSESIKNTYLVENFVQAYDGYIYISGLGFVNYDGSAFTPNIDQLTQYFDSDFYYLKNSVYATIGSSCYTFYTKDGKLLFDGKSYCSDVLNNKNMTARGTNGNIVIIDGEKRTFTEYSITGEAVYSSKETYKDVRGISGYIVVIDNDDNLKVIDASEKVLATFTKIGTDNKIHWLLSGEYEFNNKKGLYIIVGDNTVSDEEILKDNPETDDSSLEYMDRGYEYYYIPTTGEAGKISTLIGGYAKPVLYLYPKKNNTKVTVTFEKPELLTTTYPKYKKSWTVTANKNGDLKDANNKYYYGLYWEESGTIPVDFSEGFYVTKDNAITFLEEKLDILGFNDRERNEFIMYWLPILEKNGKNLVYFELTDSRENYNKLNISPKPDSMLRVAIHVKKVNEEVSIKEQKLPTFTRKGFTVVEWGGSIHN